MGEYFRLISRPKQWLWGGNKVCDRNAGLQLCSSDLCANYMSITSSLFDQGKNKIYSFVNVEALLAKPACQ